MHRLPSVVFRAWLGLLLLAGLEGCQLFRPYRLPTPKPSPEFKAQQAAAQKAKKAREAKDGSGRFGFLKSKPKKQAGDEDPDTDPAEAATDISAAPGAAPTPGAAPAEARKLPERSTVKYDKGGLMKKPKLVRRRVNKPTWNFHPWQSVKQFFKYKFHGKPNYDPKHRPVVPSSVPDAVPDARP